MRLHFPRVGVSLRTRLTVWYGALLAVTLLGFSGLVYFTLERSLTSSMDDALRLRAEQIGRTVLGQRVGQLLEPEDVPPWHVESSPLAEFAAPGIYPQLVDSRGAVIYAPANLVGGELPVTDGILRAMRAGRETLTTVPVGDANVRLLTVPLRANGAVVGGVQVGQSLSPLENTRAAVARLMLTAGAGALLLAMVVGWLLTRQALVPVARITATARHIAQTGDYRQRLHVAEPHIGRGDELFFMAGTFNDMIARLELLIDQQRRLLADTSHELRNPLTVVRGNLALLRRESLPDHTRREAAQEADEEAARMGRLLNDLLLLARAQAGQPPSLQRQPFNLRELAAEVLEQTRPAAGRRSLLLSGPSSIRVLGDRDRLKQLLVNLVDNAVRHTAADGHIRVSLVAQQARSGGQQHGALLDRSMSARMSNPIATLTVADDGAGIGPQHLPHVFERFYRADPARPRADGGAGLGLPIALAIAQAHGGTIEARSLGAGRGSAFHLQVPMLAEEASSTETERTPTHDGIAAMSPSLLSGPTHTSSAEATA